MCELYVPANENSCRKDHELRGAAHCSARADPGPSDARQSSAQAGTTEACKYDRRLLRKIDVWHFFLMSVSFNPSWC